MMSRPDLGHARSSARPSLTPCCRGYDEASGDHRSGGQRAKTAKRFRKGTAVGSDNWPIHEYANIDPVDLDEAGIQAAAWKSQCVVPMQYLMKVMSMIPKKKSGIIA